jgi:hypothetical protein
MRWKGSGKDCIMRNCKLCAVHQILFGDQIKKNEIDGACGTNGGQQRYIKGFGGDT